MRKTTSLLAALALAACASAPPNPLGIRPPDQARLASYPAILSNVDAARAQGAAADVAVLNEALRGAPQLGDPTGDWACRTIKMGRLLPLVVYGNFRCRISEVASGVWRLEKLTGSQRTRGNFQSDGAQLIYLGVGYVGDAPAVEYPGLPASQNPVEPGQTVADVGIFELLGPDRARIFFPQPILESNLDILYLTR